MLFIVKLACQQSVGENLFVFSLSKAHIHDDKLGFLIIFNSRHTDPLIWSLSKILVMLYFLWLAKEWPALMTEWERIERQLPVYDEQKKNYSFVNKIKMYTIFITLGLVG